MLSVTYISTCFHVAQLYFELLNQTDKWYCLLAKLLEVRWHVASTLSNDWPYQTQRGINNCI